MKKSFIEPREKSTVSNSFKIWGVLYVMTFSISLTYYFVLSSDNAFLNKSLDSTRSKIDSIKHTDAIKLANIKALNSFDELKLDYEAATSYMVSNIKKDLNIIPNRVLLELYTVKDNNTKFIGKVFEKVDYELMRKKFLQRYDKSTMSVKELPTSFDILTITNKKN